MSSSGSRQFWSGLSYVRFQSRRLSALQPSSRAIWAAGLPDVRNISTARFLNSSWYGLMDFIGVSVMRYFPLR